VKNIRTVTLEILRDGLAHNQLLSPLTRYLALCGNHGATTINVPFEHEQLLYRLRDFTYRDTDDQRRNFQLEDLARVLGSILGAVSGLIAELAEPCEENALTQLRLILSASELALLPFELAQAPNGFPGAGQSLVLQAQQPLCITREVRRVSNIRFKWPDRPRILFAAAAPPGYDSVPLEAHLLALRKVIDPWVVPGDGTPVSEQRVSEKPTAFTRVRDHIAVLPQATARAIQEKCADEPFGYVHILAHGVPLSDGQKGDYGLALHGEKGGVDKVSGERLANMLRTYGKNGDNRLSGPAVVTLASCDSGRVRDVHRAGGASIAHALHAGGIPLVVASQFPMSYPASVLMAQVLYDGLLWGADPRTLLNDLRRQLRSRIPQTHDWASLVAYAAFPANLDDQLSDVRFKQAKACIDAALQFNDDVNDNLLTSQASGPTDATNSETRRTETLVRRARERIRMAKARLLDLLSDELKGPPGRIARIHGLFASTDKRLAEILFQDSEYDRERAADHLKESDHRRESIELLESARASYWVAFKQDRASSWALVQWLALEVVLEGPAALATQAHYWTTAKKLADLDIYNENHLHAAWAHGSLAELHLLAVLDPARFGMTAEEAADSAREHAAALVAVVGADNLEVYTTRRQIERYFYWFCRFNQDLQPIASLAAELGEMLPYKRWL
jgi:hypothetical protein